MSSVPLTHYSSTIELAQPGDLLRTFVDFGPALGELLSQLSKSDIVTRQGTADYLVRLLAAFPVAPGVSPRGRSVKRAQRLT